MVDDDAARSKPAARPGNGNTGDGEAGDGKGDNGAEAPVAGAARGEPETPSEVERLRAELAAANDRQLRERAELENFKKRVARERMEALRFANEGLLRDLLPVIDNLQRALEHARTSREFEPIIAGVELVLRSFGETLERHGVKVVEARGAPFDPGRHEAIGHVESDQPPNTVVDEHQRGYMLHDRLLRPALVTVGKAPDAEAQGVEKAEHDD